MMIDIGYVNLENTTGNKVYIKINMASLTTQNEMRDGHLKDKEAFFNVKKFPTAIFEANEIVKSEGMSPYAYIAKGKLTLKGITKDVELKFTYQGASPQEYDGKKFEVCGFEGETIINRNDFGIDGGGAAEDVKIEITLEAFKEIK
jgi:polyisoprenoid-binding protein YceI